MNAIANYYEKQIFGANKNLTPIRQDIAAKYLEKHMPAPHYVEGVTMQVLQGVSALREKPDASSEQLSQMLFGEHFVVYEKRGAWAWGQSLHDYYVGYIPVSALDEDVTISTHRVKNLSTNLYEEPDGKSKSTQGTPLNSTIRFDHLSDDGHFVSTPLGWIPFEHIVPINEHAPYVEVAEMFLGCPYLWGGRTLLGIDCSGLVQAALNAAGIMAPRDTGMQYEALSASPTTPSQNLERGDIVFFPGHVGIMADEERLIHANAFHMTTVVEPLEHVIARLKGDHENPITGVATAGYIAAL